MIIVFDNNAGERDYALSTAVDGIIKMIEGCESDNQEQDEAIEKAKPTTLSLRSVDMKEDESGSIEVVPTNEDSFPPHKQESPKAKRASSAPKSPVGGGGSAYAMPSAAAGAEVVTYAHVGEMNGVIIVLKEENSALRNDNDKLR